MRSRPRAVLVLVGAVLSIGVLAGCTEPETDSLPEAEPLARIEGWRSESPTPGSMPCGLVEVAYDADTAQTHGKTTSPTAWMWATATKVSRVYTPL